MYIIRARGGDDVIIASKGNYGYVDGDMGDDTLVGNRRRDHLEGGMGRDRLDGAGGTDGLRGGADQDTFIFRASSGQDYVSDFNTNGQDHDVIQIAKSYGIGSFRELMTSHVAEDGRDLIITLDETSAIHLTDVRSSELTASLFDL